MNWDGIFCLSLKLARILWDLFFSRKDKKLSFLENSMDLTDKFEGRRDLEDIVGEKQCLRLGFLWMRERLLR
jgi:hypothetical protein